MFGLGVVATRLRCRPPRGGNCAAERGGGGFWWYVCGDFSPNGGYYHGGSAPRSYTGLYLLAWHDWDYSLKAVQMAFRATN